MNGYELTKFFDSGTGWMWSATQSQIYTNLRTMQADGLIEGAAQVRGQVLKRTQYSLTDKGREELQNWIKTPKGIAPLREPVFVQALFFDLIETSEATAVLDSYITENEALIEHWSEHRDRLRARVTPLIIERLKGRPAADHDRIARIKAQAFQGAVDRARANVDWARATRALLLEAAPAR